MPRARALLRLTAMGVKVLQISPVFSGGRPASSNRQIKSGSKFQLAPDVSRTKPTFLNRNADWFDLTAPASFVRSPVEKVLTGNSVEDPMKHTILAASTSFYICTCLAQVSAGGPLSNGKLKNADPKGCSNENGPPTRLPSRHSQILRGRPPDPPAQVAGSSHMLPEVLSGKGSSPSSAAAS